MAGGFRDDAAGGLVAPATRCWAVKAASCGLSAGLDVSAGRHQWQNMTAPLHLDPRKCPLLPWLRECSAPSQQHRDGCRPTRHDGDLGDL